MIKKASMSFKILFYLCSVFLILLSCLFFSFSSVSFFKRILLNSCTDNSEISISLEALTMFVFFGAIMFF